MAHSREKGNFEPPTPVHRELCLSPQRMAKHFGVCPQRIWRSLRDGEVPHFKVGNLYRARASDVPEDVLRKWKQPKGWKHSRRYTVPEGQVVYFIAAENGPIKIGLSRDPITRLARLNTSSPVRLELVAVCLGDNVLEREYHARFHDHRLNGEWFHPHPDVLAEIERLSRREPARVGRRHRPNGGK